MTLQLCPRHPDAFCHVSCEHEVRMKKQWWSFSRCNLWTLSAVLNAQCPFTLRINDQHRSWTLDKRHRQTVHNQTLTLHVAHQSELQLRKSMEFKWKYYNEMDNGSGTHKMIWKWKWRELQLGLKSNGHHRMGSRGGTFGYFGSLPQSFIWMRSIKEIQTRIWQGIREWKEQSIGMTIFCDRHATKGKLNQFDGSLTTISCM